MGKKKSLSVLVLPFLLGPWLTPSQAPAGPPDNYTATMVMEGMTMPIARMGTKMRAENPMMQGMVTLHFMDTRKMVIFSTVNKTYMEQDMMQEGAPSIDDPRVVVQKKKIGSETLAGHPCDKYDAVFYMKEKPGEKYKAVLWEARDLGGLAIRTETALPPEMARGGKTKVVNELKDIKVGAAKASMFEVPRDYRKVQNMMEVMGGTQKMEDLLKGMKGKK